MTTIREAIDQLAAVARKLPAGLDSDLEVVLCDGGGITSAPLAEIDTMVKVNRDTGEVTRAWAIVQGHSHGENVTTCCGVAENVEDELRKLTNPEG